MEKVLVLIVGAGPSGLAAATCLSEHGIPYRIVEREDCSASLWRKRTYDRLKLHLAKEFCELPHMSHPSDTPKYITKEQFVRYVDEYVDHFNIFPKYSTSVESCEYDEVSICWDVIARDLVNGQVTEYTARFLVVATGENSEGIIPTIPGLHDFPGDVIHSSNYKSWNNYAGKGVLVVGCGNSGMEIAYDLASNGVETSLVIRSPVHVMTKDLINLGMRLLKWHLPVKFVDFIILTLANIRFGDLSKYGIVRPDMGPLLLKAKTGRSAVIDVGTTQLIKAGVIKVLGPISCIRGNTVEFEDGKKSDFDSLVFATGYKSTANTWLKNGESLLNANGMPKRELADPWKGDNGLYCVGLGMAGLAGISRDAKSVAADIKSAVDSMGPF
ncbi:probable indole-3-pyruvate monooxygenase YUCCA11 [Miscanthus floridulus]|uniref:probable indole-3-pyruvate monooxygenase YUCCA11 n=1 Tax=Miscanthus floridulus TaxID=154761 RepID=UPI00345AEDF0